MIDEYRVLCNPRNDKRLRDEFINSRKGLLISSITHLVLLEAEHGGLVLDQTFTPPRCMGFSRFTPAVHQKRKMLMKNPGTKSGSELKKINPGLKEVAKGNRPEMSSNNRRLEDKLVELDDVLHKDILLTEPLLELPGERNLKTI